MGYGIFRVEKLKTMGNLKGSLKHAFREQDTPNADSRRTLYNIRLTRGTRNSDEVMEKYEQLKPKKIRADQVRALEVLVAMSPEDANRMTEEEQHDFLKRSLEFANKEFGEDNLLHAQIHVDETTPHLTAFYIPRVSKVKNGVSKVTLNAKELLGGRKEYSDRQTRFYEQVSKNYGLERGEVGSKAEHQKISDYYRKVNKFENNVELAHILEEYEQLEEIFKDREERVDYMMENFSKAIPYLLATHPKMLEKFGSQEIHQFSETIADLENRINGQDDLLMEFEEIMEKLKSYVEFAKKNSEPRKEHSYSYRMGM